MRIRGHARYFTPVVAGLAALAWTALFWLHGTMAGHHHIHGRGATLLTIFGTQAEESRIKWGVLFLAGWILMTIAMMLPTILPFVETFRHLTRGRRDQGYLLSFLLLGYLSVWLAFGVVVLCLGDAASRIMAPLLSLPGNWPLPAAAFFLTAGIFQFLPLKYHCLDRCRSPLKCIAERWEGTRPGRNSFELGLRHGVSCVGCCWALMLLMFAAGSSHMLWMLALTVVMSVEKNMPWGRRLAKPLGILLLAGAVFIVL